MCNSQARAYLSTHHSQPKDIRVKLQVFPRVTLENPQSANGQKLPKGVRQLSTNERRLRPEWPPLLQSVVPLAARFSLHGTLRKPSVHACKLLGPPKFKPARAPQRSQVMDGDTEEDATLRPATQAWALPANTSGWSARPGGGRRAAPKPRSSGGQGWKESQEAATPGARGSCRAGWAPGAGRARGGDGAGRLGSQAGETGRGRRGGEGWGRRLQTPHAKKARSLVRPHSLTSPVHPSAHGCCPRDFYAKGYRAK